MFEERFWKYSVNDPFKLGCVVRKVVDPMRVKWPSERRTPVYLWCVRVNRTHDLWKTDKSFVVFLFYRSAAVISIDELLFPTWFVKLASFYGLGFIRYGDVSCFIWYFCSKSVINMLLSSFESTKKLSNQSEMPDLLANLVQPKLD